ncbi:Lrp/AsnC family transcriptional regulator [Nocardioides sp.]|uniref:Lrp/AsnC family transcriptional regulator n=1 Tax=Nocardioides sp. TaxID=35761 RepID=UPI003D12CE25
MPNNLHDSPVSGEVLLDAVDRTLLGLLVDDGRLANNTLASRAGIAPSTCLARVRRLQSLGVIRGFHADVDLTALGRPLQALIAVRLQAGARGRIAQFQHHLATLPGVLNVFFLAGEDDFQIHIAVRDPDTLRSFVVDHLSVATEVAMTKTSLIFEHLGTRPLGG